MQYFRITQETDFERIGKYPQVKELKIGFHEARASQWGKITSWKTEEDIPDLNNFILHSKSKLTDNLSNNFVIESSGLFISQKCKEVFNEFIVNGSFYPLTIHKPDEKYEYHFLWYEMGGKSKINCKDSDFIEFNTIEKEYGKTIKICDFEDYKIKFRKLYTEKEDWDIIPKTLKFKRHFDITPAFRIGLICSEEVKNAIEGNQLTGFDFRPLDVEILFD
ncbi:hypothetical protein [Chryseobacterium vaccae]|uniref:hypothetical protein n=1 Tax=Chryseobacterium vaccae TaxID=2604424 RepID=UPI0012952420|nr:hypothetical protein [Chryseobacterium vaccae]